MLSYSSSAGLGKHFFLIVQNGEKSHIGIPMSKQHGKTTLTFPKRLPRTKPAFPIIGAEEFLEKQFVGTSLQSEAGNKLFCQIDPVS
jgi:hypothetical protein